MRESQFWIILILALVVIVGLGVWYKNGVFLQPQPAPAMPVCAGFVDTTQLVMRNLPSGYVFYNLEPFDDKQKRYFLLDVDNSQAVQELWLFDMGSDGVFSNDDFASILPSTTNPLRRITFMRSTGGEDNLREEFLYWVDMQWTLTPSLADIKRCKLPSCTSQQTIITNMRGNINGNDLLEYKNRLYFHGILGNPPVQGVFSCSLKNTATDWCGGPQTNYVSHTGRLGSGGVETIRKYGIAALDATQNPPYNDFFDVASSRVGSYLSTTTSLVQNSFARSSPQNILFTQYSPTFSLVSLDTTQNSFTNIGLIDAVLNGIYPGEVLIEPRANQYPIIFYAKYSTVSPFNRLLYKKDSVNPPPTLLDDFNFGRLSFIKGNSIYVSDYGHNKLFSYNCY
ncbi:MAG: hypothetical protein AABX95_02245 [Nanoarchaeota archaeon]